jgi:poly(A) polymerase
VVQVPDSSTPTLIERDEESTATRAPSGERRSRRRGRRQRDPFSYTVESERPQPLREETVPPTRVDYEFDSGSIDADAAKVVQRLVRQGHEAYLVGGCVRDLLLGKRPKDFDVATSARPEAVREAFRNSRVIGRRFRLVHVLFGRDKVIETATFRRSPSEEERRDDLLIRDDNAFGEAFEDAARRDFTINALFYDIESKQVLDWCSGMQDIANRSVRTIGDPVTRFREDPVRMLRAVKFCARLDLGMDPDTYRAIVECRSLVRMAAKPRLFEELLRLLRGGAAHRSIWLLWETGLLDELLPELSSYLYDAAPEDDRVFRLLGRIDALTQEQGAPPDDIVLLTLLLLEPLREACGGQHDRVAAAHEFLEVLISRLSMPRRITDAIRRIVAALPRLESEKPGKFARTPLFQQAMMVLEQSRLAGSPGEPLLPEEERPRRKARRSKRSGAPRERAPAKPNSRAVEDD